MRPPLTYWGGKQDMLKHILPLIPLHNCYIEPFCGGAAVFFAKAPAKINILNDKHDEVVNFYRVLKSPLLRRRLFTKINGTPYARLPFLQAMDTFLSPKSHSKVDRAWALFTACGQAFNKKLDPSKSWSRSAQRDNATGWHNRTQLTQTQPLINLLNNTQIDNRDACHVIRAAKENSFLYVDPPYLNADQGHYSGYDYTDFEALLQALEKTPAQFMLSSYKSELLNLYVERNGWTYKEIVCEHKSSPLRRQGKKPTKVEVLTMNYTPKPTDT